MFMYISWQHSRITCGSYQKVKPIISHPRSRNPFQKNNQSISWKGLGTSLFKGSIYNIALFRIYYHSRSSYTQHQTRQTKELYFELFRPQTVMKYLSYKKVGPRLFFASRLFAIPLENVFLVLQEMKDQSQSTFTCSKSTIETLEQSVKYVQS